MVETIPVWVSTLANSIGYCEFKVPLVAKGVQERETSFMRKGTEIHKALERKEAEEKTFVEMSADQIKQLIQMGGTIEFKMEGLKAHLRHGRFDYIGRADKIGKINKRNVIIDEIKTTRSMSPEIFENAIIQCIAYAIMTAKKFGVPITRSIIRIRKINQQTGETLNEVEHKVDKKLLAWFYSCMKRFEELYLGESKPRWHGNHKKCLGCNSAFTEQCDWLKKNPITS